MIRQAIVTTFYGPTNTRGSRIKAQCYAKTMWFSWDHALEVTENHRQAAARLAFRLGWVEPGATINGGSLPGKGFVWMIS